MTRREQIDKAAIEFKESCRIPQSEAWSFLMGAEWADTNNPRVKELTEALENIKSNLHAEQQGDSAHTTALYIASVLAEVSK